MGLLQYGTLTEITSSLGNLQSDLKGLFKQFCYIFTYRWKFVIHGCIDGHTRVITYLQCADNNRADTVFHCFRGAVAATYYAIHTSTRGELLHSCVIV